MLESFCNYQSVSANVGNLPIPHAQYRFYHLTFALTAAETNDRD